ncbi:TetR/AcrR family transcriptional regulator [Marinitenerispora sediminis]|uniref:TetR family transcriptional regulator n=1 Tax=Marinitenerispora sediminis TaxID=1931232 RepID=A0A368T3P7_9ACTN|nr:TetR family transcriptional regulator [Marinitenerispora sediminis]RCV55870.1 TetR family transcriptional regulator [Marinitenerispora sediminis]RCV57333.1 TetR family transcriptional regulator [Marinitenerispora sediminis]
MPDLTSRGERRREQLVAAAADILAEEGFAGVSHRTVATRAGVPLGSTTYYFDSLEDLARQALGRMGERFLTRARALLADFRSRPAPDGLEPLARLVVDMIGWSDDTPGLPLFYESYVQAGRNPGYAAAVREWNAGLVRLLPPAFEHTGRRLTPEDARLLLALCDGLLVTALAENTPDPAGSAARALAAALPRLRTG